MKTTLLVNKNFVIAETDPNLFGGFIEHLGRAVYNGIYEPGHPTADENGFRRDVAELVRDIDMPLTRYPGGNFVSGFDWRDGTGPVKERPVRADYAWNSLEPNLVGIDEFIKWCRLAKTEPIYAVNLGTNTPKAAQEAVEYCNFPGGTYWSELRKKNGSSEPYNIRYWCLGNEMDGEWQIGHKTAEEYGRIAHETAKMMKMADRNIKLCACGSSCFGLPTFAKWDLEVLRHLFNDVDYLSLHIYFGNCNHDIAEFLSSAEKLDFRLESAAACCDQVAAEKKSGKKIMLSLDEWNVWYRTKGRADDGSPWTYGTPQLEEIFDMSDVLVNGGALLSMLDHCDRLTMGCIAQTVNVIAIIMTRPGGGAWKQTIYYPLLETSRYGRGTVLRGVTDSPGYDIEYAGTRQVKYLRATAVWRKEANEVTVFAINRSTEEMEFSAVLGGFETNRIVSAVEIHHDDLNAVNTENDEQVCSRNMDESRYHLENNTVKSLLKPYSWNMFRVKLSE